MELFDSHAHYEDALFAFDRHERLDHVAIIELKRDGNVPSPALDILREVRIKRSGFSKYCIGSALTQHTLRRNNFKERLIMISKIENKL